LVDWLSQRNMGHLAGKDIYRKLGTKIDNLTMRAPWNDTFHAILKELYSPEEAEVAARMPYGLPTIDGVSRAVGFERSRVRKILDSLCAKGLVMDLWINGEYRYTLSPMVIGIFEFTMMRTGENLNTKEWARLFHSYLSGNEAFYKANFSSGEKVSPLRTLPHEEVIDQSAYVEILDHDKAADIIEGHKKFSIGICSCRHEKLHAGTKKCNVPLDTCSTFGDAAEYMVRRGFAKPVSRAEMLDNLARAKDLGLVICADNVRQDISFLCFCCGCCCNVMLGISRFGYPGVVVTSNFIAQINQSICSECGTCEAACPIQAVTQGADGATEVNRNLCIGCGVCGLTCQTGAMSLIPREHRTLLPEDTFERVILQSLEKGTLQNLFFPEPERLTHKFMRAFVGGFLRLSPVKKALMADSLRSSFLEFMRRGA
jgi:Pyruvate/2-oxoacid:ferredoxin oxidoreductase delta subunit